MEIDCARPTDDHNPGLRQFVLCVLIVAAILGVPLALLWLIVHWTVTNGGILTYEGAAQVIESIAIFVALSFAVICVSFGVVLLWKNIPDDAFLFKMRIALWKSSFLGFWIMAPPHWFAYEFFFLWKDQPLDKHPGITEAAITKARDVWINLIDASVSTAADKAVIAAKARMDQLESTKKSEDDLKKDRFDRFKQSQDIASKAWIALHALLTCLYFGKDFSKRV